MKGILAETFMLAIMLIAFAILAESGILDSIILR